MITCVAANPSIDRLLEIAELTPGAIHRPLDVVAVPGGKGLNVARAISALGGQALVVALLAGHAGRWINDELTVAGIERRIAWTGGETRTCVSIADRRTGQLTQFYEIGTPATTRCWDELVALVDAALTADSTSSESRWMTISGSLPPGAPTDGYATLIESARRAGVRAALDTSEPWLTPALAAGPQIVKVNADEAAHAVGASCSTTTEVVHAAVELRHRAGGQGRTAIVTRGPEGIIGVTDDGSTWEGHLDVQGSYPVGSGDAFLAGLILARSRRQPWPRALACALGAGTANASTPGAGRLDAERAAELTDRAEVAQIAAARQGLQAARDLDLP